MTVWKTGHGGGGGGKMIEVVMVIVVAVMVQHQVTADYNVSRGTDFASHLSLWTLDGADTLCKLGPMFGPRVFLSFVV